MRKRLGPKMEGGIKGALATGLAVALLIGCGSGGSTEASSSAPLTKKEFIKQGNALCDKVLGERDTRIVKAYKENIAEYRRLPKAGQERLAGKVALEVDLPLYRKLVHELGALTPPARDQKTVDHFLAKYEAVLDRLFEHPEDLQEEEPLAPYKEAAAYGLISCNL